jgi:hypothetical protein
MPKAQLTLASGTKITVEGTEEEVARLVTLIDNPLATANRGGSVDRRKNKSGGSKLSIGDLIAHLVDEGFFKKPVELSQVKSALEQQGHYFTRSAIPTQLLRLVKRRQLRRIKQDGQWRYVG